MDRNRLSKRADHHIQGSRRGEPRPGELPEHASRPSPAASLFPAPPLTLAESEDRFRSLLRFSYDWYWEQDENFRFTANLRGFPERPGIRAASYVGKTRWEMPCSV